MESNFNPRSLAGATSLSDLMAAHPKDFNPRSLAGATASIPTKVSTLEFQSTLPRGSDRGAARLLR